MRRGLALILSLAMGLCGNNVRAAVRVPVAGESGPCCCCKSRSICKCGCQKPKAEQPNPAPSAPDTDACFCEGRSEPLSLPRPKTCFRPDLREVSSFAVSASPVLSRPGSASSRPAFVSEHGPPLAECYLETFVLLI